MTQIQPNWRMRLSSARKWLERLLVPLVLVFVGWTGLELSRDWDPSDLSLDPTLVLASAVPVVAASLFHALAWLALLRSMSGIRPALVPTLERFFASLLGRYAPAKLALPLIRMQSSDALQIGVAGSVTILAIEVTTYVLTGAFVGFVGLELSGGSTSTYGIALAWSRVITVVSALLLIVLASMDRRHIRASWRASLGMVSEGALLPWSTVVYFSLLWFCWYAHGIVVIHATGVSVAVATSIAYVFVLAPLGGFLALVAPGGLGVREALMVLALSPALGASGATMVAVISRIVTLVCEVLVWLLMRACTRWMKPHDPRRFTTDSAS